MSFLLSFFRPKVPRCDRVSTSDALVKGLQLAGNRFYSALVEALRPAGANDKLLCGAEIVNETIGGDALVALQAYELLEVSVLLSICKYIPESQGGDFAAQFFSKLCGSNYDQALIRAELYRYIKDRAVLDSRFADEVGRFMLGGGAADIMPALLLISKMVIPSALPAFRCHIGLATAIAFGDDIRARDFGAQLRRQQDHGLISM